MHGICFLSGTDRKVQLPEREEGHTERIVQERSCNMGKLKNMRRWRYDICFALAASFLIILVLTPGSARIKSEPESINLALYQVIPEYENFETTVKECWQAKHPDVELNIVDWDCYDDEVPADLDVFVIDTTNLDIFADKGYLLPLDEAKITEYDDLIPAFADGCSVDDTLYAIPQLLCADILYTRRSDNELKGIDRITTLTDTLGDSGLLLDKNGAITKICLYMQSLNDIEQEYLDSYPPIEEGSISEEAAGVLTEMAGCRQTEEKTEKQKSDNYYYYARRFAEGLGKAYIGYSEAMNAMGEDASEMDFRLLSMFDSSDIPVFYIDAAAINSNISDEKKALAYDLLNMITGTELLAKASVCSDEPLYLLTGRYSVYDMLSSDYPIYAGLKDIAATRDAHVFRIKPDGAAYMAKAEENADALPDL